MNYKFNEEKLSFEVYTKNYLNVILIVLFTALVSVSATLLVQTKKLDRIKYVTEETRMLVIQQENAFSEEKLREYIIGLNVKFPHIVFAQAKLESGYFKSTIFRENNNLFGMKIATRRPTTNKGENRGHAAFDSWKESVVDYAFYQARYLGDIRTEAEYIQYLKANYAEDPKYIEKVIKLSRK
jgi:hypothetical protein